MGEAVPLLPQRDASYALAIDAAYALAIDAAATRPVRSYSETQKSGAPRHSRNHARQPGAHRRAMLIGEFEQRLSGDQLPPASFCCDDGSASINFVTVISVAPSHSSPSASVCLHSASRSVA
jgi:hypothetical protein